MATDKYDVVIIGAGFTGLTAAYMLAKQGYKVQVIESDTTPGGLAGTFSFTDGVRLEKFYHHWFNNDHYVLSLAKELEMESDVIILPSRTGMYFNQQVWRLSTPKDLLFFTALPLIDRIRLGLLVFYVRRIVDWHTIEHLSIREWLEPLCGKNAYRVVWEPLITSKFSIYAETISAVWMWKKLVLRGGTRNHAGKEELAYFKGGFGRLADAIVLKIKELGGNVSFGKKAIGVQTKNRQVMAIETDQDEIIGRQFLFTPAFPIIANIFKKSDDLNWLSSLHRIRYLGNACLVIRLKQSLSETYWLNVNDPNFPFVGVIEHTNFDISDNYKGTYIIYLSRYLAIEDPVWSYDDDQYFIFTWKHLKRMFPAIKESWVIEYKVWRAEYAQPVAERNYSKIIPTKQTPFKNAFISTMAQIYPEDRGTNYAIREGKIISEIISEKLKPIF